MINSDNHTRSGPEDPGSRSLVWSLAHAQNEGLRLLQTKHGRSLARRNHIDNPIRQTTGAEHYFESLQRAVMDYNGWRSRAGRSH